MLGLCQPDGTVIHYRGAIRAVTDSTGTNRTVNDLLVENYLKGVLSREVPSSWGNAGGGAGMHALYAMAVAARSFALSQNRYPCSAKTCDTSTCQVYGGAAYRAQPEAPTSYPTGTQVCEAGNPTFECANTNRAVAETAGRASASGPNGSIVSGEYSATHGPYSLGRQFPAVDDSVSNVPQNPLLHVDPHVDAADIDARCRSSARSPAPTPSPTPPSPANGVWGNRVVLQGTAGVVVSEPGLPQHLRLPVARLHRHRRQLIDTAIREH